MRVFRTGCSCGKSLPKSTTTDTASAASEPIFRESPAASAVVPLKSVAVFLAVVRNLH